MTNTETELDKVFEDHTRGECDICGCYSTRLFEGICQKAVCNRYVDEGKAISQKTPTKIKLQLETEYVCSFKPIRR